MKLLTFEYDNKESLGILVNNNKIYPIKKIGINYESMNELICNISDEEIKLLNNKIFEGFCDNDLISVEEVKKSAPIPIPAQDIICLGINYSAHAEESARYKKKLLKKIENILFIFQNVLTMQRLMVILFHYMMD